jgi:hypothetical protein
MSLRRCKNATLCLQKNSPHLGYGELFLQPGRTVSEHNAAAPDLHVSDDKNSVLTPMHDTYIKHHFLQGGNYSTGSY